jgi:hypothetical protein
MKIRLGQILAVVVLVPSVIVFFHISWVRMDYKARMPTVPSGEQTIRLMAGKGCWVYVNQEEYNFYQRNTLLSQSAGAIAFLALICLVCLKRAKQKQDTQYSAGKN